MIAKIKRWLHGYTPETPLQREQRKNVSLHFELAAANKRADEAEAWRDHWQVCATKAEAKLTAIKRAKSAAVAKGNRTRKAKREAAAEREGLRQSIVQ